MKLGEIAEYIGAQGQLNETWAQLEPRGVSIDSRTIRPGELFFALRGPRHDGHDFVGEALTRGACGAVISEEGPPFRFQAPQAAFLRVKDTLAALHALARAVRERWGGPVIGITGSAGKTMTKELTARLLAAEGARVLKSAGNFNNAYGLPLALLQLISAGVRPKMIDYIVVEMGMSAAGELTTLCSIAHPDVGIVTNVSSVHLAFFPSVEAIAEAKAELIDHLKDDGLAVLNLDDPLVARMRFRRLIPARTFGIEASADVTARNIQLRGLAGSRFTLRTPRGDVAVTLPLLGRHNIYNALAAVAVADYYGVSLNRMAQALSEAVPAPMRGELIEFPQGFKVINDAYNSNPRALTEMVTTLCAVNGVRRRIVVAGEMLELGHDAARLHRACGREMARRDVDVVVGVQGLARELIEGAREEAEGALVTHFCETPEAAAHWLFDNLQDGDLVLVKGSRGVRMERVIETLWQLSAERG